MWLTCHEHGTKKKCEELNLRPSLHRSDALNTELRRTRGELGDEPYYNWAKTFTEQLAFTAPGSQLLIRLNHNISENSVSTEYIN